MSSFSYKLFCYSVRSFCLNQCKYINNNTLQ